MKNNLKMSLGILTVLATPFAVDAATGSSEAHAAQVKETAKKQVVTTTKQTETAKKTENTKKENTAKKDASKEKTTSSTKTVSGKSQAPVTNAAEKKTGWTSNGTYYVNGKLANWWYDDGKDWYFFQNGKKHTGEGKDNAGKHYFANGKYANGYQNGIYYAKGKAANWWYDDGKDWYFFQNGKKHTGEGKDNAGKHYFSNGKYANGNVNGTYYVKGKAANGYQNGTYYDKGKAANWWYDDGKDWYFFQNGKKHTGEGKDNAGKHYFANGKYANGNVNGTYYAKGKAANGYQNGTYYDKGKVANWWYDDGKDWYFFQNGKKHTGEGKDNAGKHYFANGKYANGYQNGIYYAKGKAANWWYDDGKDWFYFKDGKKFTGIANDSSGKHEFVNGKYAQKGGKAQGVEATSNQYSGHYKVTGLYIPVYDSNGKILSHVSQGTIIFKDNRASASGRIPVQVAGLVGYVNPSQVQAVNSSTTFIPDYVSDGKYVYHRYSKNSKLKVAYHNSSMQVGKSYYSADGINFGSFKLDHPFQFSSLKSKTNYTAADINKLYTLMGASNSMLAGKGAAFKAAEQKYGVNALYLVAHSALESAWGRSNIAKAKNNFFGIAAYDSSPYTSATKFDNVDAGILGAARWINDKYLSNSSFPAKGAYLGNKVSGMNVNYATAPYWGESIASIMFDANDRLGNKDK